MVGRATPTASASRVQQVSQNVRHVVRRAHQGYQEFQRHNPQRGSCRALGTRLREIDATRSARRDGRYTVDDLQEVITASRQYAITRLPNGTQKSRKKLRRLEDAAQSLVDAVKSGNRGAVFERVEEAATVAMRSLAHYQNTKGEAHRKRQAAEALNTWIQEVRSALLDGESIRNNPALDAPPPIPTRPQANLRPVPPAPNVSPRVSGNAAVPSFPRAFE